MSLKTQTKQRWPFSPQIIDNLSLWLDASDTSSFTLSGTSVTQWRDKSWSQYTAVPIDSSITTTTLNGLNVMNFGSNRMAISNFSWNSTFTILFVAKAASALFIIDTANGANSNAYGEYVFTGNGTLMSINNSTTNTGILEIIDNVGLGVPVVAANQWFIFSIGYTSTGTTPTNYAVNGTVRATSVYTGSGGGFTNPPITLYINGVWNAPIDTSQVAEIIFFNNTITTNQCQQIEGYLAQKWGLQSNLPATQPYKSIPTPIYSRPFQPVDISGCLLWLDAADTTTISLSGTSVISWNDKSGNGYNATPGGSPTYVPNSQYNSGTVYFDGVSNYLYSALTVNAASHSMFIVHNPTYVNTNTQQNDTSLLRFQVSLGYIVYPYNTGARYGYINSFGPSAIFGQLPEGDVAGVYNIIDAIIADGSQQTYQDGSLVASYNAILYSTPSDPLVIGAYGVVPYQQQFYQGNVAEIIIYDTPLLDTQRQQVEQYLAWKWGIQSYLPTVTNTPLSVPNLLLWLDATDPLGTGTPPANNTSISTWYDKSGNANNATQATGGNQPYYTNSSIVFSGGQYLNLTNPGAMPSGTNPNGTYFFVIRSTAGGVMVYFSYGSNNPVAYTLPQFYVNSGVYTNDVFGGGVANTGINDINVQDILSGTISNSGGTGYTTIYRFGTGYSSSGYSTTAFNSQVGIIGAVNYSGSIYYYFTGYIYEMMVYNGVLSTTQRQAVEGYLSKKWNIQLNYTSTIHPGSKLPAFSSMFTPTSISGLQLWFDGLDPNANGTIPSNGSTITTWYDKSGNANNATASGTVTYTTSNNSITFNSFAALQTSSISIPSVLTVFVVCQCTGIPAGTLSYVIGFPNLNAGGSTGDYSIRFYSTTNTLLNTNFGDFGNQIGYYVNGTFYNTSYTTITLPNGFNIIDSYETIVTGSSPISISNNYFGTNRYFIGNVQEVIVYTSSLTLSQRQQVEGYLAWKWGLQANLPSSHEYAKFMP